MVCIVIDSTNTAKRPVSALPPKQGPPRVVVVLHMGHGPNPSDTEEQGMTGGDGRRGSECGMRAMSSRPQGRVDPIAVDGIFKGFFFAL